MSEKVQDMLSPARRQANMYSSMYIFLVCFYLLVGGFNLKSTVAVVGSCYCCCSNWGNIPDFQVVGGSD